MTILNNHLVVELWNGSDIVRVVGKASIMQLVYVNPAGRGVADGDRAGGAVSGSNDTANAPHATDAEGGAGPLPAGNDVRRKIEIYGFDEAIRKGILKADQRPGALRRISRFAYNLYSILRFVCYPIYRNFRFVCYPIYRIYWCLPHEVGQRLRRIYQYLSQKVGQRLHRIYRCLSPKVSNIALGPIDGYTEITADDVLNDHSVPNISLNVSSQKTSDGELWAIAIIGIFIQLGVIAFAGFGALQGGRFRKDGKRVVPYAFPLMAGGTVALVLGMFLCAHIIDKNTVETRWVPESTSGDLSFKWVQKGNNITETSTSLV